MILIVGIVLNVTNLVLIATEKITPCATLVMMVGTSIVMVVMNVTASVVSVQKQLILIVKHVNRKTSSIQQQLVMRYVQKGNLET